MELLHFYINNTRVGFWDKTLQTTRVCIDSKVAPVYSKMFLSSVDRALSKDLDGVVSKVFRYVDDYLVLGSESNTNSFRNRIPDSFVFKGKRPKLTLETPVDDQMQFLVVHSKFEHGHVCWSCLPRAGKPLLYYASDHSRLAKKWHCRCVLQSSVVYIGLSFG